MRKQKFNFRLAEGTPCIENLTCVARHAKKVVKAPCIENLTCIAQYAFTLAEVLIVIAVIGVVAVLTIPTLINIISEKVKEGQTKTIEARLLDGINRFSATDDGLSQRYENTYNFLLGLSKYYKINQICKADEITKCIPYSKIHSSDGKASVNVSSLKTIKSFISGDAANNYLEPASFISAQGIPFVMILKKDCVWDMGTIMHSIEDSGCIAYLYDKNGSGLPNRLGDNSKRNDNSDIISHGITVGGFPLAILGGVKIMTTNFTISTGLSESDCLAEVAKKNEYTAINSDVYIHSCMSSGNDKWAFAMKHCKELGYHLPTNEQLKDMTNALYKGMSASDSFNQTYAGMDENGDYYPIGSNESVPTALTGIGSSWFILWAGTDSSDATYSYSRFFYPAYSSKSATYYRNDSAYRGICVSD